VRQGPVLEVALRQLLVAQDALFRASARQGEPFRLDRHLPPEDGA